MANLRYKQYEWSNNPTTYNITHEKAVATYKYPYTSKTDTEDIGEMARVISGEGEFFGDNALQQFQALKSVFSQSGAGQLIHPVFPIINAVFKRLEVTQESGNYVRYTFEFVEHIPPVIEVRTQPTARVTASSAPQPTPKYYNVVSGDTLWDIARRNKTTVAALAKLNPQIKNVNLIYPGDKIRIS